MTLNKSTGFSIAAALCIMAAVIIAPVSVEPLSAKKGGGKPDPGFAPATARFEGAGTKVWSDTFTEALDPDVLGGGHSHVVENGNYTMKLGTWRRNRIEERSTAKLYLEFNVADSLPGQSEVLPPDGGSPVVTDFARVVVNYRFCRDAGAADRQAGYGKCTAEGWSYSGEEHGGLPGMKEGETGLVSVSLPNFEWMGKEYRLLCSEADNNGGGQDGMEFAAVECLDAVNDNGTGGCTEWLIQGAGRSGLYRDNDGKADDKALGCGLWKGDYFRGFFNMRLELHLTLDPAQ